MGFIFQGGNYWEPFIVKAELWGKEIWRCYFSNILRMGAAVHGTLYFKAMDDAAFFAANSIVEDVFVLTAKFELEFLKPVVAGEMCAKGRVTSQDERRIYSSVDLFDGESQLIGRGKGEFARSKILLTPEGYSR